AVAEQVSVYRSVFAEFGGRQVGGRTLDARSDKALPVLHYREEPHPALGVRGFRTAGSFPEVLHDQLEAIEEAAVSESAEVWALAPMIATVQEARTFAEEA